MLGKGREGEGREGKTLDRIIGCRIGHVYHGMGSQDGIKGRMQEGLREEDNRIGQVDHRAGEEIFKGLRLRKFWQQGRGSQHGPVGADSMYLGQTGRGQTRDSTPGNAAT